MPSLATHVILQMLRLSAVQEVTCHIPTLELEIDKASAGDKYIIKSADKHDLAVTVYDKQLGCTAATEDCESLSKIRPKSRI